MISWDINYAIVLAMITLVDPAGPKTSPYTGTALVLPLHTRVK